MEERGTGSSLHALVRALGLVGQLGFTLAGGIAAGLGAGWALDKWLGTRAVFKVLGILFGLAGGAFTSYRLLAEFMSEAAKHDAKRADRSAGKSAAKSDRKRDDGK